MELAATNVRWEQSFESEDHQTGNVHGTDLYLSRIVVKEMQSPQDDQLPYVHLSTEAYTMEL
jgi:hypothetical protein